MINAPQQPLRLARSIFPLITALLLVGGLRVGAAQTTPASKVENEKVTVVDGVVQPRRPVAEAIEAAMEFLKRADGGYVPGSIDGELAGYFTSAWVQPDGSRTAREQAFPGRQHAYFIFTFLNYHKYSGEEEWLARARDLADWNLAHSTPADARYANIPYSVYTRGEPGGSQDGPSTEPDKAAYLGSAYLALHDATSARRYLDGARAIADTLVATQGEDGSWPFRVIAQNGKVYQQFGGAPVFYVRFFEEMNRHEPKPEYQQAHDRALALMIKRNVEDNQWGTYHEDIRDKPATHLSAEPMCFTASYLFRHGKERPEFVDMGRRVLKAMEEGLVHTEGHPAAPAPAVSEQSTFMHMMPGHTARYCLALADLHAATGDEEAKRKAISGINALTYMQTPEDLFATMFQKVNERNPNKKRDNWYSQHLYTVCHVLEAMPMLPEIQKAPR